MAVCLVGGGWRVNGGVRRRSRNIKKLLRKRGGRGIQKQGKRKEKEKEMQA